MNKTLGILVLTLFCPLAPAETLTLDTFLQRSLNSHPLMQAAAQEQLVGAALRKQGLAPLLPQLQASANYDATNGTDNYRLTLSQALFDLGKFNQYRFAHLSEQEKSILYQKLKQQFLLQAVNAYINTLVLQDRQQYTQAKLQAHMKSLKRAELELQIGRDSINSKLEAETSVELAKAELVDVENRLRLSFQQLRYFCESDIVNALAPAGNYWERAIAPIEELRKQVTENNPDILLADLAQRKADVSLSQKRAQHLPTLELAASYEHAIQNAQPETAILLTLKLPIFSGGFTQSSIDQYRALWRQQDYSKIDRLATSVLTLEEIVKTIQTRQQQINALSTALRSATKAMEATEASFTLGLRNQIDILNAREKLFGVQSSLSENKYRIIFNYFQLDALKGELAKRY